ncbi:methylenetetrahydrofolate reductase, partial [Limosilactobacillus reuteri]
MTTLSYEIFPPKSQVGKDNLIRTIAELKKLDPKFISVTCSNKET